MASNYGIGASLGKSGLVGVGLQQKQEATDALGRAADEEQRHKIENDQLEQQRKQQNQTLGATVGAAAGMYYGATAGTSVGGPFGAVIGGLIGGIAGHFM